MPEQTWTPPEVASSTPQPSASPQEKGWVPPEVSTSQSDLGKYGVLKGYTPPPPKVDFWHELKRQLWSDPDSPENQANPTEMQKVFHPIVEGIKSGAKQIAGTVYHEPSPADPNAGLGDILATGAKSFAKNTLNDVVGLGKIAMGVMPQALAFQATTNAVKEATKDIPGGKQLNEGIDNFFSLAHYVAGALGRHPEPGSTEDMMYTVGDLVTSAAAMAGSTKGGSKFMVDSFDKLKDNLGKIADHTATPEQIEATAYTLDAAKHLSKADLIKAGLKKGTPEAVDAVGKLTLAPGPEMPPMSDQEQHDILYESIKGKEDHIPNFLANMEAAKNNGQMTEEEYQSGVERVNAYQQYWNLVKDRGLPDETNKQVFDLTWKTNQLNKGIKNITSDIEGNKTTDPAYAIKRADLSNMEDERDSNENKVKKLLAPEEKEPEQITFSPVLDNGIDTGWIKNSKGAFIAKNSLHQLEKLGYSEEDINNLSQSEVDGIRSRNIVKPIVESTAKIEPKSDSFLNNKDPGFQEKSPEETDRELPAKITVEQPKVLKIGTKTYEPVREGDNLHFKDEQGNLIKPRFPSGKKNPKYAELLDQHKKNYDYTQGDKSTFVPSPEMGEQEADQEIINTSNNPSELAEVYTRNLENKIPYAKMSQAERDIYDSGLLGKIQKEGFININDQNNVTPDIRKNWFHGKGEPIDTKAEEISEHVGREVTDEDLANYIIKFPKGHPKFDEVTGESAISMDAAEKFKNITGFDLDPKTAYLAMNQALKKEGVDYDYLNNLSDEQLENLSKENEQAIENERTSQAEASGANKTENAEPSQEKKSGEGEPPKQTGQPSEPVAGSPDSEGMTKKAIAESRKEKGVEPLEKQVAHDLGEDWTKVKEKLASGQLDISRIAREIMDDKRAATPEQKLAMGHERMMAGVVWDKASEDLSKAKEADNESDIAEATERLREADATLKFWDAVNDKSQTMWGRYGRYSQELIQKDRTLSRATQQLELADRSGDPLKSQHAKKDLEKAFAEYKELKDKVDAHEKRIEDLEKQNADILKQQDVNKALRQKELEQRASDRKEGRQQTKEQIQADRAKILANLSKLAKQQRSTLSANPISAEMIVEMGKLVHNYIKEGVVDVAQMVDNIHSHIKGIVPDVGKKQVESIVHDALKSETPSETGKKTLTLEERQAKAQKSLESAIDDLSDQLSSGKFKEKAIKEPLPLTEKMQDLKEQLKGLKKDIKEAKDLKFAQEQAWQKVQGVIEKAEQNSRTKTQKVKDAIVESGSFFKSMKAGIDYAAVFTHGSRLWMSHPTMLAPAFREMLRQNFSAEKNARWLHDLKMSPDYRLINKFGLFIDERNMKAGKRAELYASDLAERIPGYGKIIKAGHRAYAGFLNKLRTDVFMYGIDKFREQGLSTEKESDTHVFKAWADLVNNDSGRGKLLGKKMEAAAPMLNSVFFSPRLWASRLAIFNPVRYYNMPQPVRMEALRNMGSVIGMAGIVMALAKANGAKVNLDPKDSNFGKIQIGKTHIDAFGGFQQPIILLDRIATGKEITGRNPGKVIKARRLDLAVNYGRGKLSPLLGETADLMAGRDLGGNPHKLDAKEAINFVKPITITDLQEIYHNEGAKGLEEFGIPAIFGVHIQTKEKK